MKDGIMKYMTASRVEALDSATGALEAWKPISWSGN